MEKQIENLINTLKKSIQDCEQRRDESATQQHIYFWNGASAAYKNVVEALEKECQIEILKFNPN